MEGQAEPQLEEESFIAEVICKYVGKNIPFCCSPFSPFTLDNDFVF